MVLKQTLGKIATARRVLPASFLTALGFTESLTRGCRSWKSTNNSGNRYVSSVSGTLTASVPLIAGWTISAFGYGVLFAVLVAFALAQVVIARWRFPAARRIRRTRPV